MSVSRKIAVNTLSAFAGRIVSGALGLVSIGFITRALGREGFGEYSTVLAYLALFMILADLGLQALLTREMARVREGARGEEEEVTSNFFTFRLFTSLFFLLLGFLIVFFLPYSTAVKLGAGVGMSGFFFLSLSQLLLSVFQKYFAMHLAALAEVLGRGAQLLIVFLVFKAEGGLLWFLFAMSAASLVIFLFHWYFASRYIKIRLRFKFERMWNIVRTTWPIAVSLVFTLVYFKIDTILLSLLKPQTDVGIYGVAYRVLEGLIFFPAIFAGIVMPILSKEAAENIAQFKKVFEKSVRVILLFAVPLMGGGAVLAYSIARALGGKEFIAAGAPLQPLFLAIGLIFLGNILGRGVIALDLQKRAVLVYFFGMIFNVALNLFLIPKYTYMGAAWATAFTELLVTLSLFFLIWQ
jgi:O-antigen/teichoic acid export membrane protein